MTEKNNITFHEEQRFRQTWVWIIILPCLLIVWYIAINKLLLNTPVGNNNASNSEMLILWLLFGILFPIFFYKLKLTTEVRKSGLYIRFFPFHLSFKRIPREREKLKKHEVRTYSPITEYGGWGIKWGSGGKAYNVSGNRGVQLEFTDGKRLLIGSQKPEQLDSAIEHYFKNYDKTEINTKERRETL
jgi:hypothetical protein